MKSLIPTSLSSVNGWNEKYSGSLYTCSKDILIDNSKVETLSYSGDTPTTSKRGGTYQLNSGQTITSTGTGAISYDYTESDKLATSCTTSNGQTLNEGQSLCVNTLTLETCNKGLDGKLAISSKSAIPPQVCRTNTIVNAYTVDVVLSKTILSTTDSLKVDFTLSGTPNNKDKPITAEIWQGTQLVTTQGPLFTGTGIFDSGKTSFTFSELPIGSYFVRIKFSDPDGNYQKDFTFKVTENLALSPGTPNPIQFDNKPIEVYFTASKSGSPKALTSIVMEAYYNGQLLQSNSYVKSNPNLGKYVFTFNNLQGDGDLVVKARGTDETGYTTDWTEDFTIKVKKAYIIITPTNLNSGECTGTHISTFETKDSSGNLIETSNSVSIGLPLGECQDSKTASVSGSNGKYSFTYSYTCGGFYTIFINSNSPDIGSSQLNSGTGQGITILTGSSCGGDGPTTDYTMYFIGGGFLIAIGLFIYFLFFFRRKK